LHIRVTGTAVAEMELNFVLDWNFVCPGRMGEQFAGRTTSPGRMGEQFAKRTTSPASPITAEDKYFPAITPTQTRGNTLMQIVASGPDAKWPSIYHGYCKMISESNKSIYMITPYFAPDDNIFETLKIAALSGIDVRIIIPAHPDHPFVLWCSLSYLGELVRAGVKCYKYKKGFIHSKLLLIDDMAASVGTTNMDIRSFKLNFEINAFIYDRNVCGQLKEIFMMDLEDCEELTTETYAARPVAHKIKEAVSRLLSPLL